MTDVFCQSCVFEGVWEKGKNQRKKAVSVSKHRRKWKLGPPSGDVNQQTAFRRSLGRGV